MRWFEQEGVVSRYNTTSSVSLQHKVWCLATTQQEGVVSRYNTTCSVSLQHNKAQRIYRMHCMLSAKGRHLGGQASKHGIVVLV